MGNSNSGFSEEEIRASERFEAALANAPAEEQISVGLISKNVLNGCSWSFVKANPEIRRHLEDFQKSKVCSVQKVTYDHKKGIYGYLVYMQMSHLCKLLGPDNNGPLEDRDLQIASHHRDEAVLSLVKKMKAGYKGRIGIFCVNDSQAITIQGVSYPAFAVTLKELCTVCSQNGYGIVIGKEVRDPNEVIKKENAVIERLTIAPSENALLINIAPMR